MNYPEFKKYRIHLSNKSEIQIDEDEVEVVTQAIQTGKIGRVRRGVFNPSFFVSLTLDDKRYQEWKDDNQYKGGPNQPAYDNSVLKPLKDIFSNVLPAGKAPKQVK